MFWKISVLIMLKILHFDAHMEFAIEPKAIVGTILLYFRVFSL